MSRGALFLGTITNIVYQRLCTILRITDSIRLPLSSSTRHLDDAGESLHCFRAVAAHLDFPSGLSWRYTSGPCIRKLKHVTSTPPRRPVQQQQLRHRQPSDESSRRQYHVRHHTFQLPRRPERPGFADYRESDRNRSLFVYQTDTATGLCEFWLD
jgi:hypothetical protein